MDNQTISDSKGVEDELDELEESSLDDNDDDDADGDDGGRSAAAAATELPTTCPFDLLQSFENSGLKRFKSIDSSESDVENTTDESDKDQTVQRGI